MKLENNPKTLVDYSHDIGVRPFQKGPLCRFYNLPQNYVCNFPNSNVMLVAYLIPCIDEVGPFEMDVHMLQV